MSSKHFIIAVLITAIWGFNFSIIKLGLENINPFFLAGLRFFLCAIPTIFFVKKPDVSLKIISLYGVLFGVGLWGMVNVGMHLGVSAGIASLVLQFGAFFSIIIGSCILKEAISNTQIISFFFALLGLVLVLFETDGSVTPLGIASILIAAIIWSLSNLIIKKSGTKHVFSFLVWSCLFSPLPLFILAYLKFGYESYEISYKNFSFLSIFSILFQVYPTTLIGYWVWNKLLRTYPISTVAPLTLLVPIFGFIGSFTIFGETINMLKIFACLLIFCGLIFGSYGEYIYRYLKHKIYFL